nr:hypothetical protein GCM10020093_029810 [Planobispora longispora]
MDVLDAFQSELAASTDRLVATVARLSDADLTAPSRLPGWTRGHLITHIARNADSLVNLTEWARTGVERPQYPSVESRDADIAAGAVRPAKEQLADLEESAARLATAFRDLPPRAWSAMVGGMRPPRTPPGTCWSGGCARPSSTTWTSTPGTTAPPGRTPSSGANCTT